MALTEHEEQAFWEFVASRRQHLVRTAYLLSGDHGLAEDFVQDALIRAHRYWRRIERADQPEVYVRRIIVNLANSWWRRALRHRTHVAWQVPDRPDESGTPTPPWIARTSCGARWPGSPPACAP